MRISNSAVQTDFFYFSETLTYTVPKDKSCNEIGTALGTVLCQTGDWEGGRCNRKKKFVIQKQSVR